MIESTALFFAITYLMLLLYSLDKRSYAVLFIGCFAGTIAALTKVTTYVIAQVAACLICLMCTGRRRPSREGRTFVFIASVVCVVIPIVCAWIWTSYADEVRSLNPIGSLLTSKRLTAWMFGTLSDRVALATWQDINSKFAASLWPVEGSHDTIWALIALMYISVVIVACSDGPRWPLTVLIAAFWSGPLIFTNLYRIHEYYWYANGVFLMSAAGLFLGHLSRRSALSAAFAASMAILVCLSLVLSYHKYFYPFQKEDRGLGLLEVARFLEDNLREDEVMFVRGCEWDPALPYCAKRRALMIPSLVPSEQTIEDAIKSTGLDKLGALVVCPSCARNELFIDGEKRRLGIPTAPAYRLGGHIIFFRAADKSIATGKEYSNTELSSRGTLAWNISAANLDERVGSLVGMTASPQGDAIQLDSTENAPYLSTAPFDLSHPGKYCLRIRLTVDEDNVARVFWARLGGEYNQRDVIPVRLIKGENSFTISFPSPQTITQIRLDPGSGPGKWVLNEFSIWRLTE